MGSGKMGALVIMIAIVGALIGSWVMSMDVNEDEVTKYADLADMTGEFQSIDIPQYTRFNPSTNYTGYFTNTSIVDRQTYFDGVSYAESSVPNNYRLDLTPITAVTDSLDLTDATTHPTNYVAYWDSDRTVNPEAVRGATLAQFVADQGWTGMDEIKIVSDLDNYQRGGFFTFFAKSEMRNIYVSSATKADVALIKNPILDDTLEYSSPGAGQTHYYSFDPNKISNPILACKYTIANNQVQLFYDREMQDPAGIYAPNDAMIFWSLNGVFGTDGTYSILDLPAPKYMDPSQGVELA